MDYTVHSPNDISSLFSVYLHYALYPWNTLLPLCHSTTQSSFISSKEISKLLGCVFLGEGGVILIFSSFLKIDNFICVHRV